MIGCGFKYGTKIDAIDAKVRQVIQMIHHTLQISPKKSSRSGSLLPQGKVCSGSFALSPFANLSGKI